jgi:hypothetical protein
MNCLTCLQERILIVVFHVNDIVKYAADRPLELVKKNIFVRVNEHYSCDVF